MPTRFSLTILMIAVAPPLVFSQEWSSPSFRIAENVGYVRPVVQIHLSGSYEDDKTRVQAEGVEITFYRKERDNQFIVVGTNLDGRLQLFYRSNRDGHLYTQWQAAPNAYDQWSEPKQISKDVEYLAVAQNQDGRLQVFMRGSVDKHLYTRWQLAPNAVDRWSGTPVDSHRVSRDIDHFAVARNQDGRLQVLMRGNVDGHLYTRWQNRPNGVDDWSGTATDSHRVSLDIKNDPGCIAVAQNADGRLQVFVVGGVDGHLYTRWQNRVNGVDSWSGSATASHRVSLDVSNVTVGRNDDGGLISFMRGSVDGHMYHRWQTKINAFGSWSESERMSLDVNTSMAVAARGDRRMQVFMGGSADDHLYSRIANGVNTAGQWSNPPQQVTKDVMTVAVGRNKNGRLQVFVMGSADERGLGHLYTRWQLR